MEGLLTALPKQCSDVDQPQAALIRDLKDRGLLDETLVIWGGEFGRTTYSQGKAGDAANGAIIILDALPIGWWVVVSNRE